MTFRDRLREQIEFCGLLDKEVAAQAGISKRTIDSYVGAPACMPSAEIAVRLAKILNVSVEYLITGEISQNDNTNPKLGIINQTTEIRARKMLHLFTNLSEQNQELLVSFAEVMEKKQAQ